MININLLSTCNIPEFYKLGATTETHSSKKFKSLKGKSERDCTPQESNCNEEGDEELQDFNKFNTIFEQHKRVLPDPSKGNLSKKVKI